MGSVSIPTAVAVAGEASADAAAGAAATAAATTFTTAAVADTVGTGAAAAASLGSAIGTGSSVFTLANAATAAGLVGSAASAYGQHQAGVATSNEDKQKARVETLQANQKAINMRQNMMKALSSQNAMAGVGGIGTGGSFGANVNRQITQNQNDLMANSANESAQVSLLDQAGSNAQSGGNVAAGGTLLKGLGSAAGL
jgi:hypothetical protein